MSSITILRLMLSTWPPLFDLQDDGSMNLIILGEAFGTRNLTVMMLASQKLPVELYTHVRAI